MSKFASSVDGYDDLRGIVNNPASAVVLSLSATSDFGDVRGDLYVPPQAARVSFVPNAAA